MESSSKINEQIGNWKKDFALALCLQHLVLNKYTKRWRDLFVHKNSVSNLLYDIYQISSILIMQDFSTVSRKAKNGAKQSDSVNLLIKCQFSYYFLTFGLDFSTYTNLQSINQYTTAFPFSLFALSSRSTFFLYPISYSLFSK